MDETGDVRPEDVVEVGVGVVEGVHVGEGVLWAAGGEGDQAAVVGGDVEEEQVAVGQDGDHGRERLQERTNIATIFNRISLKIGGLNNKQVCTVKKQYWSKRKKNL